MNLEPSEKILRQERIHAGIFAAPVVLLLLCLILDTVILLVLSRFGAVLSAYGQNAVPVILFVLVLVPTILPVLAAFVAAWLAYLKSEITLTSKRLAFRTGFVMRVSGELPLGNVEAILLVEPLVGRWLGYGTIAVTSVGGDQLPLQYIGKPQVFHAVLQQAVAAAKAPPARPPLPPATGDDSRYMPKG